MELSELQKDIHENAVAHGWWEEERSHDEIVALFHSEISEAFEEYRSGHGLTEIYYNPEAPDKPEGIPIELADYVIRLMDWGEKRGVTTCLNILIYSPPHNLPRLIKELHKDIAKQDFQSAASRIAGFFKNVCIDLEATIRLKHAYNVTRPYRHGGKVC